MTADERLQSPDQVREIYGEPQIIEIDESYQCLPLHEANRRMRELMKLNRPYNVVARKPLSWEEAADAWLGDTEATH